ncbi:hypothetical protein OG689_19560 [Kitasatospora sp. NBC_00240]|uniref:hypothetical protein n=1 Tax=Kitasatospora sp. NBC_00240 TaxID=2903567 RepID=UPI00225757DE|nr:hypothetical protein [Kitasatospora sp. NBC_00240]MCX5211459.1 hypothetical protein [Kitasatospora sp. NBC_00240]
MTMPGFQAEASLRRSPGPYARAPRPATAGALVVPMWSDEERQRLIECDRRYTNCEYWCDVQFPDGPYELRQQCNVECNQDYDACAASNA